MHIIRSIKDPVILRAKELQQKKERIRSNSCLLYGLEQVLWALENGLMLESILIEEKHPQDSLPQSLLNQPSILYSCSEGIMKKASGTNYLIPILAIASLPPHNPLVESDICVVLDGLQDLGNIGTIVRTAHAFGIDAIAFTDQETELCQRKTIDASRGTVFSTQCKRFDSPKDAALQLKEMGYQIVVTALEGSTLQSITQLKQIPVAIVFGNETTGVSQELLELADLKIQIPMATTIDSLNVGVAAGISLYELKLQLVLGMLEDKIRGSLGRNLTATAKWLRAIFDLKLRQVSKITADQAIILMMLSCDETGEKNALLSMANIDSKEKESLYPPLEKEGYLTTLDPTHVQITQKGKELLAKIWAVNEQVEHQALKGFSNEQKKEFGEYLKRIQTNLHAVIPYE